METRTIYFAGAPFIPGTGIPNNVTGECCHVHKSAQAAQKCIDKVNGKFKNQAGMAHCYVDRIPMMQSQEKVKGKWRVVSGTTKPCSDWE